MTMRRALIEIHGLSKHFGREKAVNDVTLDIYDKEFLVLLGPSGCGKTTLLRLLGGFENPSAGSIRMDGRDIAALPPNKRPLNMVFQSYAVFPHMNVRDNIAYGLRIDRVAKPELERRVDEALALVRLDALAARYSHQLSGGQRQRVALARALVKRPRVLLLDEPLSALDAKLREAMQNELVKLQHSVGITFVVVTHDQDEALSMAERVAVMESGRIRQLDTPRNLYEAPRSRFVADFVGRMNILPARAIGGGRYAVQGLGDISAGGGGEGGSAEAGGGEVAYLAIRPEKLFIAETPAENPAEKDAEKPAGGGIHSVRASIDNIAYYGGQTVLTVTTVAATGSATLTIAIPNSSRRAATPPAGARVVVWWRAEDVITLGE
ncbi:MAG: ABC transporter ATP-binding protein [Gammaproteobacteria bacterium]